MAHEHLGVITALLGACRKHGTHQQEVLQLLMEVGSAPLLPLFSPSCNPNPMLDPDLHLSPVSCRLSTVGNPSPAS